MAFNPAPTSWFTGWSEDGIDITLPITSVRELTAAEADAVSGDIRKVCFALVEEMYQQYNALATDDKPGKFTITKIASLNASTGILTNTYTVKVYTEIGSQEVADE